MTKIKSLSPIIIWLGFTIYVLLIVEITDISLMRSHYINFLFLGIATVSFLFGQPIGQLTTFLMLVLGFFAGGAFTPSLYYFNIGKLTSSHLSLAVTYLPLIIYFITVNRNDLPYWFAKVFNDKQTK